jgi:hypothetical protein
MAVDDSTLQQFGYSDVFIIGPENSRSVWEAAQNAPGKERAVINAINQYLENGPHKTCIGCDGEFDSSNCIFVVTHWLDGPPTGNMSVGALCEECSGKNDADDVIDRHLEKLGIDPDSVRSAAGSTNMINN